VAEGRCYGKESDEMKVKLEQKILLSFLFAILISCGGSAWAVGDSKGSLDKEERVFFNQTLIPILIKSKVCASATGDCLGGDFFICLSWKSLSCGVYGITDEKVIKELLIAVINSNLKVSSFTFWRSKYHETGVFEKPLVEYVDRTRGKY